MQAALRGVKELEVADDVIIMTFAQNQQYSRDQAREPDNLRWVEAAWSEVLGCKMHVQCILQGEPVIARTAAVVSEEDALLAEARKRGAKVTRLSNTGKDT